MIEKVVFWSGVYMVIAFLMFVWCMKASPSARRKPDATLLACAFWPIMFVIWAPMAWRDIKAGYNDARRERKQ